MGELWQRARDGVDAGDLDGLADLLAGADAADRAALLPLLEEHRPPVAQAEPVELPPLEPEPEPELPTGSFAVAFLTYGNEPPKIPQNTGEWRAHLAAQRLRERERAREQELYHLRHEATRAATRRNIARQAAHAFAILACTAKAPDAVRACFRPWPDALLDPAGLPARITDPRGAAERVNHDWPPPDLPLWPMMTPSRPEIAAMHIQPYAVSWLDGNNLGTGVLAALASLDGPDGPAMALLLAYTLGNHRSQVRLAAADLLLARAARPGWTGTAAGEQAGELAAAGLLTLQRIVAPLTEALRGGAHEAVWQFAAAALPPLLALPPRPGLADLVELAATAARTGGGPRPAIAGLSQAAAGRNRLATAARRLEALTAP
ncbi:hypothetical protein [Dactylosporangium salmoneum]|uniref:HEAT repeat domain-containing protein n=1 Tax=Dactylosporangium salmoneum TaxID=53361 RepID=A0ABP5UH55_9ACTN